MELTDRKKQILKIVVDGYVATAEPVSSKAIAEKMPGRINRTAAQSSENAWRTLSRLITVTRPMCARVTS